MTNTMPTKKSKRKKNVATPMGTKEKKPPPTSCIPSFTAEKTVSKIMKMANKNCGIIAPTITPQKYDKTLGNSYEMRKK